jgi:hypothetical protein
MMKRFTLAIRVLLGLPVRGVRIDEALYLDDHRESEVDHSKSPPFELVFNDSVQNGPAVEVVQRGRFRVCVFREKATSGSWPQPRHWLVLELGGDGEWYHLMSMHGSRLPLMQEALDEVARVISPGPRMLPRVEVGGQTYFIDARLKELRNVENPHDRIVFCADE